MIATVAIALSGMAGFTLKWMEPGQPQKYLQAVMAGSLCSAASYSIIHYPVYSAISAIAMIGYCFVGVQQIGSTLFPCF